MANKRVKFLHVVHNLDGQYQGKIHVPGRREYRQCMEFLGVPEVMLVEPWERGQVLNPSRCALACSDQWATVSKAYRAELFRGNDLAGLLALHDAPFAFPNGVDSTLKRAQFQRLEGHLAEKAKLIRGFFNTKLSSAEAYGQFVLFGFIGRICQQKGVLLILEVCEEVIKRSGFKALFVIGGMVDGSDYSIECARRLEHLCRQYPENVWADPQAFFGKGLELTLAADFFLMPSAFEPGGIVQHEALVAGTPVIAFKTGGLKDSITSFRPAEPTGNGFLFEEHSAWALKQAIFDTIALYKDPKLYATLRRNCSTSFIDLEKVVGAWRGELSALQGKVSSLGAFTRYGARQSGAVGG